MAQEPTVYVEVTLFRPGTIDKGLDTISLLVPPEQKALLIEWLREGATDAGGDPGFGICRMAVVLKDKEGDRIRYLTLDRKRPSVPEGIEEPFGKTVRSWSQDYLDVLEGRKTIEEAGIRDHNAP